MKTQPPQRQKSGQRITVSLTTQDHTALSALADRCDVSLSWLTRHAIAEFLQSHGKGELQLPLHLETKRKSHHD